MNFQYVTFSNFLQSVDLATSCSPSTKTCTRKLPQKTDSFVHCFFPKETAAVLGQHPLQQPTTACAPTWVRWEAAGPGGQCRRAGLGGGRSTWRPACSSPHSCPSWAAVVSRKQAGTSVSYFSRNTTSDGPKHHFLLPLPLPLLTPTGRLGCSVQDQSPSACRRAIGQTLSFCRKVKQRAIEISMELRFKSFCCCLLFVVFFFLSWKQLC